jgi:hypothetical protein
MVTDQQDMPGLSQQNFERVRAAYLTPCDLKKIDIEGGMVHGNAKDFQEASLEMFLVLSVWVERIRTRDNIAIIYLILYRQDR